MDSNSFFNIRDQSIINGTTDPYAVAIVAVASVILAVIVIVSTFLIITLIGHGTLPKAMRIVLVNILLGVILLAVLAFTAAILYYVEFDCYREFYAQYGDFLQRFWQFISDEVEPHCRSKEIKNCESTSLSFLNASLYEELNQTFDGLETMWAVCSDRRLKIFQSYQGVALFGFSVTVTARMLFMSYYAILVYIYIRYVFYKIKTWAVVLGCIGTWVFACSVNLVTLVLLFAPSLNGEGFRVSSAAYGLAVPSGVAIPSFIISIVLPIATLLFIKKNVKLGESNRLQSVTYSKAMAKLALFLLLSNTISITGHLVLFIPTLLLVTYKRDVADTTGLSNVATALFIGGVLNVGSLLLTPILYCIFLKHIRNNAKRFLCFWRKQPQPHRKTMTTNHTQRSRMYSANYV